MNHIPKVRFAAGVALRQRKGGGKHLQLQGADGLRRASDKPLPIQEGHSN